jgi:hypothetical protein
MRKIDRREFIGVAAVTITATQLAPSASAIAASAPLFGPLKRVRTSVLDISYAEAGPADGPPVILLHGWPYDIYSFAEVTPLLGPDRPDGRSPYPKRRSRRL